MDVEILGKVYQRTLSIDCSSLLSEDGENNEFFKWVMGNVFWDGNGNDRVLQPLYQYLNDEGQNAGIVRASIYAFDFLLPEDTEPEHLLKACHWISGDYEIDKNVDKTLKDTWGINGKPNLDNLTDAPSYKIIKTYRESLKSSNDRGTDIVKPCLIHSSDCGDIDRDNCCKSKLPQGMEFECIQAGNGVTGDLLRLVKNDKRESSNISVLYLPAYAVTSQMSGGSAKSISVPLLSVMLWVDCGSVNDGCSSLVNTIFHSLVRTSDLLCGTYYSAELERKRTQAILDHGKRSAIAAIMSRNMSHNIGSHVLSSPGVTEAEKEDLKTLHDYIQRRMDLVARITSRYPDWGEPLWFFGDLLRGFLSQNILLNHLVKDQGGWCEKGIAFYVKVKRDGGNTEKGIEYKAKDEDKKNGDDGHEAGWLKSLNDALSEGLEDFLVSIPDGTIGAQAFYVLFESLMRNSAKYGKAKSAVDKFEIHIELTEQNEYYEVSIWDNLSTCPAPEHDEKKLCVEMQGKIEEELTNKRGELSATSLGIAEMREACGFLVHPYGDSHPVYPIPEVKGDEGGCKCQQGSSKVHTQGDDDLRYPLWVECYNPNGKSDECLKYKLHLAKPQMVGIAGLDDGQALIEKASTFGIQRLKNKDELLGPKGAYQFAVIVANSEGDSGWIEDNHSYLPQRVLVVVNDKDKLGEINLRHAIICSKDEIGLDDVLNGNDGLVEEFIRKVYETWIKKRWKNSLEGNLIELNITLDRTNIPDAWSKLTSSKVLSEDADIKVYPTKEENDCKVRNNDAALMRHCNNEDRPRLIIDYSNHHNYNNKETTKSLVIFKNGDKTVEALFSPPSSQFGLDFLLLGLIEAALSKVVILDERPALWACQEGKNAERTIECQNAGTWPVFRVSTALEDLWLTDYLEKCVKRKKGNSLAMPIVKTDCVPTLAINEKGTSEVYGHSKRPEVPSLLNGVDFVVVHIGVAETIGKEVASGVKDFMNLCENLAPSVIMTSGRGGLSDKRSGCNLPFIEYSAIKECFVNNVAKYHLVRTLMSARTAKR